MIDQPPIMEFVIEENKRLESIAEMHEKFKLLSEMHVQLQIKRLAHDYYDGIALDMFELWGKMRHMKDLIFKYYCSLDYLCVIEYCHNAEKLYQFLEEAEREFREKDNKRTTRNITTRDA